MSCRVFHIRGQNVLVWGCWLVVVTTNYLANLMLERQIKFAVDFAKSQQILPKKQQVWPQIWLQLVFGDTLVSASDDVRRVNQERNSTAPEVNSEFFLAVGSEFYAFIALAYLHVRGFPLLEGQWASFFSKIKGSKYVICCLVWQYLVGSLLIREDIKKIPGI